MKKLISYLVVFVLGFIVCAAVFKYYFGSQESFSGTASSGLSSGVGLKMSNGGSNQVREAAKKIGEYVVNIDTVGKPVVRQGNFFGMPFGQPQQSVPRGEASGVVFTSDGYILTNNHVVADTAKLKVTLHDNRQFDAKLIGRDPVTDMAVIKIDAKGLKYAQFADSDNLAVGDWVIAVGNALGLGPTVTIGIVSVKRGEFEIGGKVFDAIIQTDAAINQGNSGGALADLNGNLVGINTAILSTNPGGGNIGIGFAVPSNTAKKISEELVKNGKVDRAWIGIMMAPYNDTTKKEMQNQGAAKLPNGDGAVIMQIIQGSPAAKSGLQPYDIILKINGKKVSSTMKNENGKVSISSIVRHSKVGEIVRLEVWRAADGRIANVGVRLGKMPPDMK